MPNIISFLQIIGITGDSVVFILLAIILLLFIKLMLHREFKENNTTINKKFDGIYEKFDGVNKKFENINSKISKMEGELSTLFVLVKEKGFLKSQSPLQLSDEGKKFKKKIHGDVIFERNKKKLITYMKFPYSNDYDIQQDAFYCIPQENFEKSLEKKELDEIKQIAYQEGQTLGETLIIFKVLLRDYSIDYNKKFKKLRSLLGELKNLDGVPKTEHIHVRDSFWGKISALDKKEKEAMATVLRKLGIKMEANKIMEDIPYTVPSNVIDRFPNKVVRSEYLNKAEEFYNFLIDFVKVN